MNTFFSLFQAVVRDFLSAYFSAPPNDHPNSVDEEDVASVLSRLKKRKAPGRRCVAESPAFGS